MSTVLGKWSTAESMFARQQSIVERLLGQEPAAFLQVCSGFHLYHRGEYEEACSRLERGLTRYRTFGTDSLAWHLGLLGLAQVAMGDFRAARRCLDEQEELIAALPDQNCGLPRTDANSRSEIGSGGGSSTRQSVNSGVVRQAFRRCRRHAAPQVG